jgi:hypothetical protein
MSRTGFPKTVTITNEMIATIDAHHLLPLTDGIAGNTVLFENKRIYGMLPIFHVRIPWTSSFPQYSPLLTFFAPSHITPISHRRTWP